MIDLHLHSTASDGALAPADLAVRAAAAGITTLALTDHDTCAGVDEASRAAHAHGLGFVAGIEITAVWAGSDVHLLAYFVDPSAAPLRAFLAAQRADRERRARAIAARLGDLGMPIDIETIIRRAAPSAVSRPNIAQALADAGHATGMRAAFDAWLVEGRPAFVSRVGATPHEVVTLVRAWGGAVSMAHPALTAKDDLIPALAAAGLTALEVYHSDHAPDDIERYRALAQSLGLAMTGGSDYHGTPDDERVLGGSPLPEACFLALLERAGRVAESV